MSLGRVSSCCVSWRHKLRYKMCLKVWHFISFSWKENSHGIVQGTLTEGEGSVQLTSKLRWFVLLNGKKCLQYQKQKYKIKLIQTS
jgi:hypothetical protein